MANPYLGEIRLFGGNFNPLGWALCNGQLLPIAQNDALFNLIGTTYGGDGQTTFALPDLRGRVPVHQYPGNNNISMGAQAGWETVTLNTNQLAPHNHDLVCNSGAATTTSPAGNFCAAQPALLPYSPLSPNTNMNGQVMNLVGGSQPHDNMVPFLTFSFIIALEGIYPTQT